MELVVCDVTFEGRDEKCICFLNGVILLLGYAKYNAHMLNQVFMTLEEGTCISLIFPGDLFHLA